MPDGLAAALMAPGLPWVALAMLAAGIVYGFAGFGAALVFMPVAVIFWPAALAVAALALSAVSSAVTVLPAALRVAERRNILPMIAAATVAMPFGVWLLRTVDPVTLRWAVCVIVLGTLALLLTGWRLKAPPTTAARMAVGAAGGAMGASTGLNGPAVILFNLAGSAPAAQVRAETLCFLTITSLILLPILVLQEALTLPSLWLGALLFPVYGIGTLIGRALFRPGAEATYRRIALIVIAAAGVMGLPIW